jgi:tungstate transport system permease protein
MQFFIDSILSAILLIRSLDPELFLVVWTSLSVSLSATALASGLGIPLGFVIASGEFPGKRGLITVLNTLLALPTVVVGLFVYVFISRQGMFGELGWLYTKKAMILGQTILILPLVTVFVLSAISRIDDRYAKTALTLGADRLQLARVVLREARFGILAAIIAAFGRVVAEIGISMMLGGNIKGFTRTMTTAMALEYDKGEFALAVALGIILLAISFGVNVVFNLFQGKSGAIK